MMHRRLTCVLFGVVVYRLTGPASSDDGWKEIFDGKTLNGWKAPDMSYFSIENGAITGTVVADRLPPRNQFIVWQGGVVEDFELIFKFRIFGAEANSGMQFRSDVREHGLVHGYQADIAPGGASMGGVWDEYGTRAGLALRGEKVVISEDGKKTITRPDDPEKLIAGLDLERWNEYHVVARGPRMVLKINGRVTADLEDREQGKARRSGVLAMPVIPRPMKVQYKDIRLKRVAAKEP